MSGHETAQRPEPASSLAGLALDQSGELVEVGVSSADYDHHGSFLVDLNLSLEQRGQSCRLGADAHMRLQES